MKSVCIIGAGAAGLCVGKACLKFGYSFTIFEQAKEVGGTWVFHEGIGGHSSMYEKMHTNLPKEIMCFPGFPFPENSRSFVDHVEVLRYLQDYGRDIHQFIKFDSKVVKVSRNIEEGKWNVKIQKNDKIEEFLFDIVFVCNGHFFEPRFPDFSNDFSIPFIHSHDYRKSSDYSGKTVAIVGAGPSGVDIALQDYLDSLFFIGLNMVVLPFLLFEFQTSFAFSLIEGRSAVIKKEQIDNWEQERLQYLTSKDISHKYFHILGDSQWDYYKDLAKLSKIPYSIPPVIQKIYEDVGRGRRTSITEYKTINYEILSETEFRQYDSGHRDFS
ncbi:hypothetical protein FO519_006808 [Halicephalobus sp. NKZ332]|nr:hypothetical protein FO519_006808 [Halicephalobus sp. NKZ332]